MRLEQLRYFVQIVECRSFNKASKCLHITQPALTSAIKALEDELGLTLFMRDRKGIITTTFGQRFMKMGKISCKNWMKLLNHGSGQVIAGAYLVKFVFSPYQLSVHILQM